MSNNRDGLPVRFHNGWFLLGAIYASGAMSILFALCLVIFALTTLFPVSHLKLSWLWDALCWAFGVLCFGTTGLNIWRMARKMKSNQAMLTQSGVEFRLGEKKKLSVATLGWDEIVSIHQQRVGNAQCFTVRSSKGAMVEFTSFTFFRPKKLAKLLAQHSGKPVVKV